MSFNDARRTSSHPPLPPVSPVQPTPPEPTTSQVPSASNLRSASSSSSSLWPTLGIAVRDRADQKLEAGKRKAEGQHPGAPERADAESPQSDKKAKCVQAAHRRPPAAHAPLEAMLEDAPESLAAGTLDARRIGVVLQQCAAGMTEDEPLTALGACLAQGMGGSAMREQTVTTAVQALFAGIGSLDERKTQCVVQGFVRSLGGLTLRTGLLQRLVEVLRPIAAQAQPRSPAHIALLVLCASQNEVDWWTVERVPEHKGEQAEAPTSATQYARLRDAVDVLLQNVGIDLPRALPSAGLSSRPGQRLRKLGTSMNVAMGLRHLVEHAAMPAADRARLLAKTELAILALQPYLRPREGVPAEPAACAQKIDAFLAQHRHDTAADRLDLEAQVLGWRLGLHTLPRAAQAQVIEHAVDRLRASTTDLERQSHLDVLGGLIAAIARPPGAQASDGPALLH